MKNHTDVKRFIALTTQIAEIKRFMVHGFTFSVKSLSFIFLYFDAFYLYRFSKINSEIWMGVKVRFRTFIFGRK